MMDIIFAMAFGLDIDSRNNPQSEIVKHGNTIASKFYAAPTWRMDAISMYTLHWKTNLVYLFPSNIYMLQMININLKYDI